MLNEKELESLFILYQKYLNEKYSSKEENWENTNELIKNIVIDRNTLTKIIKKGKSKHKIQLYKNKSSETFTHMFIDKKFFRLPITDLLDLEGQIEPLHTSFLDRYSDKYGSLLTLVSAVSVPLNSIYIVKDILPLENMALTGAFLTLDALLATLGIIDFKLSDKAIKRAQGLASTISVSNDALEIYHEKLNKKLLETLEMQNKLLPFIKENINNEDALRKIEERLLKKLNIVIGTTKSSLTEHDLLTIEQIIDENIYQIPQSYKREDKTRTLQKMKKQTTNKLTKTTPLHSYNH